MNRTMDANAVESLIQSHAGMRLLRSANAPLVISFLHYSFMSGERKRNISRNRLIEMLGNYLDLLRLRDSDKEYLQEPREYLDAWVNEGWLTKIYFGEDNEICHDLTSHAERAIGYVMDLQLSHSIIPTKSRLMTMYATLRKICNESESNPDARIAELEKRKEEIDKQIESIRSGKIEILTAREVKEEFLLFCELAKGLIQDFREIEQNFRRLDTAMREKILSGETRKGTVLGMLLDERTLILDSEQGKSFDAFWKTLTAPNKQEEFSEYLKKVFSHPAIVEIQYERNLRNVYSEWLSAGQDIEMMMVTISEQLRRFISEQSSDIKRIREILSGVDAKFYSVSKSGVDVGKVFFEINETHPDIDLPMFRLLNNPKQKLAPESSVLEIEDAEFDVANLIVSSVSEKKVRNNIENALAKKNSVSLGGILSEISIEYGLEEVLTYVKLFYEYGCIESEDEYENISWVRKEAGEIDEAKESVLSRTITIPKMVICKKDSTDKVVEAL